MIKKVLLSIAFVVFVLGSANAQYKIEREKYNYKEYKHNPDDPYKPSVVGLVNWLLPGVGHYSMGENARGNSFLFGYIGSVILYSVGVGQANDAILDAQLNGGFVDEDAGNTAMGYGLLGIVLTNIWSIVDGVRVAKVKNMAYHDKKKTSFKYKFSPAVITSNFGTKQRTSFGAHLTLSF